MITVTYTWRYLKTGEEGQDTIEVPSLAEAHIHVNAWNRLGAGTWQYWI